MRILFISGKGSVGKSSLCAATGVRLAELGYRTVVMSVDPAHSLTGAFGLKAGRVDVEPEEPSQVADRLWIHEVNVQQEIKRNWQGIWSYISSLWHTSGMSEVEAEAMAAFPGLSEISALLYINEWHKEQRYDVVVLDCAPTAESLRFVSLPTSMKWYLERIAPVQRRLLKVLHPIASLVAPFTMPPASYFDSVEELFTRLEGIDGLLQDPRVTSVRLITDAEKIVVRETQRAFVHFSVCGLTVDQVVVNRVLPGEIQEACLKEWHQAQSEFLKEMGAWFDPVPVRCLPLFRHEIMGWERIRELARELFPGEEDPAAVTRTERSYTFGKRDGVFQVRLQAPWAAKGEIGLFKQGEQLVVEVGTMRRHIGLPTSMAGLLPARARFDDNALVVELQEAV